MKPGPRRCQPHNRAPVSLPRRVHLSGCQSRIAFDFLLVLSERKNRVVKQISSQPSGRAFEPQRFVNNALETGRTTAVKAPLIIRIPSRVFNPCAQVPGATGELIHSKFRFFLLPLNKQLPKFWAQFFVRVERQNPIIARGCSGKVLLFREIRPCTCNILGLMSPCSLLSAVPASAIHDDDLIRDTFERTQCARQVVFLVRCNQTGGETIHRTPRKFEICVSISQQLPMESPRRAAKRLWRQVGLQATSSERSRGSSFRRCEIRFRPGAWRRARVPLRKMFRWLNPCPSD